MNWLWGIPFFVVSGIHLAACFRADTKIQAYTKPFLMPLLLLFYLTSHPSSDTLPFVCAALTLGFLGDVLLLNDAKRWSFLGGIAAFLLGHVAYGIAMVIRMDRFPPVWLFVLSAVALGALGLSLFRYFKPHTNASMLSPMVAYLTVILSMAFCALSLFFARPSLASWLVLMGSGSFMVSDALLSQRLFVRPFPRDAFIIMCTYIAAQALLAIGLR